MDLEKLAQLLGLPKESPADKVYATLAERVDSGTKAAKSLEQLSAELPKHGLKLDGSKVLKMAPTAAEALDLAIRPEDDEEKQTLKKRLLDSQLSQVRGRLDGAKAEAERLVKLGLIPPAHQAGLTELLSIGDEAHALALSTDGAAIVKKTVKAGEILGKILKDLPSIMKSGLSRLATEEDGKDGETKTQELSAKGAEIARKALGKKTKETAGAK